MKFAAILSGEKPGLVELLGTRGIKAFVGTNRTIVHLQIKGSYSKHFFEIPFEVIGAEVLIGAAECGGRIAGDGYKGKSTVVCSSDGEPLKPHQVRPSYANGVHALFQTKNSLVEITVFYNYKKTLSIVEHRYLVQGDRGTVSSNKIWQGSAPTAEWVCEKCKSVLITEKIPATHEYNGIKCPGIPRRSKLALPGSLDRFQSAALAAYVKSRCYRCHHTHFAEPQPDSEVDSKA